ncbi:hypothetical protein ACXOO7_09285, partial [Streptococcus thermophilus]
SSIMLFENCKIIFHVMVSAYFLSLVNTQILKSDLSAVAEDSFLFSSSDTKKPLGKGALFFQIIILFASVPYSDYFCTL